MLNCQSLILCSRVGQADQFCFLDSDCRLCLLKGGGVCLGRHRGLEAQSICRRWTTLKRTNQVVVYKYGVGCDVGCNVMNRMNSKWSGEGATYDKIARVEAETGGLVEVVK